MRKVQCYNCGKVYNYDEDGFCPKCGSFNQPKNRTSIDANGALVRLDGLNERDHAGSFAHKEFHAENRKRQGTELSKGSAVTATRMADAGKAAIFGKKRAAKEKAMPQSGVLITIAVVVYLAIMFFSFL